MLLIDEWVRAGLQVGPAVWVLLLANVISHAGSQYPLGAVVLLADEFNKLTLGRIYLCNFV